jgi:hypothetical protein
MKDHPLKVALDYLHGLGPAPARVPARTSGR